MAITFVTSTPSLFQHESFMQRIFLIPHNVHFIHHFMMMAMTTNADQRQ